MGSEHPRRGRGRGRGRGRAALVAVTAAYLAFVGWVTLGPQPVSDNPDNPIRQLIAAMLASPLLSWVSYAGLEFTANVAMFVPIGALFAALFGRRRWWLAIVIGFALTVAIETAQLFVPNRVSDIRDIVANTTGALIGALATRGIAAIRGRAPTARPARE